MLTKATAESCLKSGNLKIVQIPNLYKHTQIHSLVISTRDIPASPVKWSPPVIISTFRINFELK